MEQHCTAIHITQRDDPRQGHVANNEERWGEGCSGLSMSITQGEQWCVRTGTATSVDSQLANRARRRVFAEGHAFSLSLLPRCLHLTFLTRLCIWRDPACLGSCHLYFCLLLKQSYSKYPTSQASGDDKCLEGFERKIRFI